MTTNPDGDGKREADNMRQMVEACHTCSGRGWIVNYGTDRAQQCDACSGTGLAPQFLVQHPDFKREQ